MPNNSFTQADPVVEEITIDETPTEEQLSAVLPFEAMAVSVPEVLPAEKDSPEKAPAAPVEKDVDSPAEIEVPCRDDSALNPEEDTEERTQQKKKKLTKKREKTKKSGFNLFGRRALVLKLENLKIGSKVKLGSSGRVDLKVLLRLRPDLFKVRVGVVSSVSRRKSVASSSGEQKKKKAPSKEKTVAVKKEKTAKVTSATVVSSGDDSSDSELEAMKRKMNVKAKQTTSAREEGIR